MPSTATGRGAQVVLDQFSDHAKAARGAYATTLEGNTQKRRDDVAAGTSADGNTADGRTNSGGMAVDYAVSPSNAAVGQAPVTHALTVGETYTIPDNTPLVYFNNATVASATIIMPPNPVLNQIVRCTFFANVTTLTVSPNSGQQLGGAPTSASGTTPFSFQNINLRWQRI